MLTKDEVAGVLADMDGQTALLTRLLCGIGRRLMEGMRLRIKNADFDRRVIVVREAKVGKDRVVMLPRSLAPAPEGKFAVQRGRDAIPRPRCDCGKCSAENRLWRYRCVLYQTLTTPNRVSEFGPGSLHPEKRHCGR